MAKIDVRKVMIKLSTNLPRWCPFERGRQLAFDRRGWVGQRNKAGHAIITPNLTFEMTILHFKVEPGQTYPCRIIKWIDYLRIEPVCRSENAFFLETSTSKLKSKLAVSDWIIRTRDVPYMENVACLQNGSKKPSKTEPMSLKNLSLLQSEGKFLTSVIMDFPKCKFIMICNAYCPQKDCQPFSTVQNFDCLCPWWVRSKIWCVTEQTNSLWLGDKK